MTCHEIVLRLSDHLDGLLPTDQAAELTGHLRACEACRGVFADLTRVRDAARSLGPITPPAHVWLEIAGRIQLDQAADTKGVVPSAPRAGAPAAAWQWMGLAAALVLVTSAVYVVARPDGPTVAPVVTAVDSNAEDVPTVETVEDTLRRAEAEYERAIAQLEQIVRSGSEDVSADALDTLQRNVTTIDSAIAESRAALTDNPASQPARTSLFEALGNKVSLLQNTVVLMNEMRQGDAGAAADTAGKIKTM
jgi:hypothetical protein